MKADLLITNIGQLATCASGGKPKRGDEMRNPGLIADAAVAIADGRFLAVGSKAEIEAGFSAEEVVDAMGRAICPGFVDAHTHIVYAGDRMDEFEMKIKGAEYLEILAAGGGILSTVHSTRAVSDDELYEASKKRLDKMLRCGTTTAEIKTGYGLDLETELKMLRVIEKLDRMHAIDLVPTFLAAHAVPPEFKRSPDAYVELVCSEMLPAAWDWYMGSHFQNAGMPFFCDVFCEKGAFSVEQARLVLKTAIGFGFGVKAHVEQFSDMGGSEMAVGFAARSVDHLDAISHESISALADSKTVGVVIPTENFNAAKPEFADARELIDRGCAVAISTDYNPGSAPCPSLPMAMSISTRYQKLLPAEALNAATINGAFAMGLGEQAGSVEVGKRADLVFCECSDIRMLSYEFGGNLIDKVVKDGRIIEFC
jgi:imidazolonepropionase